MRLIAVPHLRSLRAKRARLVISLTITLLAITLIGVTGCGSGSDVDPIATTIGCRDMCERYADCFDADYDVEACTERCENDPSTAEERESKLGRCDGCVDDASCIAAVFNCEAECSGVVP